MRNLVTLILILTSLPMIGPRSLGDDKPTFWLIPHTHWEGAVFQTREAYLEMGLPNILTAVRLLKEHPDYRFVLVLPRRGRPREDALRVPLAGNRRHPNPRLLAPIRLWPSLRTARRSARIHPFHAPEMGFAGSVLPRRRPSRTGRCRCLRAGA